MKMTELHLFKVDKVSKVTIIFDLMTTIIKDDWQLAYSLDWRSMHSSIGQVTFIYIVRSNCHSNCTVSK